MAVVATAIAVSVLAACGSDSTTGPPNDTPDVVGNWSLQTVDGKAPPDTVENTGTVVVEFLDGTLTLNQDKSYKLLFHSRTTPADSAVSDSSGSTGTYSQDGSMVTIHNSANSGEVVATATETTLSFVDNNLTFVFAKEP